MNRSRGIPMRLLATIVAVQFFWSVRLGNAAPGDIFSVAAPALEADQPTSVPIHDGDTSVATKTGAFEYSYPITVPPGRNGMQPHLALHYSSQAPLYGGIAAGWSLDIPIITLDTTEGRLAASYTKLSVWKSSMAGNRPLVQVTEPMGGNTVAAYRAQNDSTFVRYERIALSLGYYWLAHAPSGTDYYFGQTSHEGKCTSFGTDYAPLTEEVDNFGNAVDYYYDSAFTGECHITSITWGQNANAAVPTFNTLTFGYGAPTQCAGSSVGAQIDYRSGVKIISGATPLTTLTATAAPGGTTVHTRTITLAYDSTTSSCTAAHSGFRALDSIQETAVGVDSPTVTLPPVTFTYGPADVQYGTATQPTPWAGPDGPMSYNLSWGYRFTDSRWPTVQSMMLDVDGDGLVDRVRSTPVLDALGNIVSCRASWDRNLGPGAGFVFADAGTQVIDLPMLKWASTSVTPSPPSAPAIYQSGPYAGANQASGMNESCALNYQMTGFSNAHNTGAPFVCSDGSSCPCNMNDPDDPNDAVCIAAGNAYCASNGDDCNTKHAAAPTILAYRWMDINGDGKVDLVAGVAQGAQDVYDLEQGNGYNGGLGFIAPPPEPPIFGTFPQCTTHGVGTSSVNGYTMCGQEYPWFIYLNHGNGVFGLAPQPSLPSPVENSPTPDEILYEPVPLETTNGDSSITSRPVGATQAYLDLDGDSFSDGILSSGTTAWSVYRGLLNGQLTSPTGGPGTMYGFQLAASQDSYHYINQFSVGGTGETVNLLDINGDGLPDRWYGTDSDSATVAINDGVRFEDPPAITTSVRPSVEMLSQIDPGPCYETPTQVCYTGFISNPFILVGDRYDQRRPIDLDTDGRVDVVSNTAPPNFNQGWQFGASASGGSYPYGGIQASVQVTDQYGKSGADPYSWEQRSDMLDIDGDGVPEGVDFGLGRANRESLSLSTATLTAPRRLLTKVDNHRGAETSITYASSSDTTATGIVTRDAYHTLPHPQWLVQSTVTTDHLAGTTNTTAYAYDNPQYSADDRAHYGFRGFGEVTTTNESGSQVVERFSFTPDWSGRLASRIVRSNAADAAGPVTIDDTAWEARALFGGLITTFHGVAQDHWSCPKNVAPDAEATCRLNSANHRRITETFTALASTTSGDNTPLLWQSTETDTLADVALADLDRARVRTFQFVADSSLYRLRQTSETRSVLTAGSWQPFAKTVDGWDTTGRMRLTSDVFSDSTHSAQTKWAYDNSTGNVLQRWKPVQNASGGAAESYLYDSNKLYQTSKINELNQETDFAFEPGTGTKLVTNGPNIATCTTCPSGTLTREQHRIRVDGLGRTIERYETFSPDGNGYTAFLVETNAYVDPDYATSPTNPKITHQAAIDAAGPGVVNRYAIDVTLFDGSGRKLQYTLQSQGDANADNVATYHYANDGTLVTATLPDPSKDDSHTVEYDYTRDSVGRPSSLRRPDGTSPSDRSGVDISYDGLQTTTTEVVGLSGGTAASRRTTIDRYGRIATVDELSAPGVWTTTSYTYSADDNVAIMTDPEGVATGIDHDWAGRRTKVTHPSGTWNYGYDANGNLVSEQTPCTGLGCESAFTSTTSYDLLDRPSSKLVAPRDLTQADLLLFGSGLETFTYDTGPNRVGRLASWAAYGPGASTPTNSAVPTYDAQGHQTNLVEMTGLSGLPALSRSLGHDYNLDGQVHNTMYHDNVGSNCADGSWSSATYDKRDMLTAMYVTPCIDNPYSNYSYVQNYRNVAGLVTSRTPIPVTGTLVSTSATWTYDVLGHIVDQDIVQGGSTPVVHQALSYFGNDDVKQLIHTLGTNSHAFLYSYDERHQLRSADAQTSGYFNASYAYGDAGRLTQVNEANGNAPGTDVSSRDVAYEYSGPDPEQLTALRNLADGTVYLSNQYDDAGDVTGRCLGGLTTSCAGTALEFVYDGSNRLRRVVKEQGGVEQAREEYWYDSAGQRQIVVKKTTGSISEMIWFIGETEAHYDGTGSVTTVNANVSMGAAVARMTRTAAGQSIEYQYAGLANNLLATVDQSTGVINTSFSYAPYGEVIEATNGGAATGQGVETHPITFNGKYVDLLSNLSYYGSRYYDRLTLTWTSPDPIYVTSPDFAKTQPRRANIYSFSLGNPLRYLDPDGANPIKVQVMDAVQRDEYDDLENAILATTAQMVSSEGRLGKLAAGVGNSFRVEGFDNRPDRGRLNDIGGGVIQVTRPTIAIVLVSTANTDSQSLDRAVQWVNPAVTEAVHDLNHGDGTRGTTRLYAMTESQTQTIFVDVDRIRTDLAKRGIAPDSPRGKKILEDLLAHEFGHLAGACHTKNGCDNSTTDRSDNELMYPIHDFSDSIYRNFIEGDIEKIHRWAQAF